MEQEQKTSSRKKFLMWSAGLLTSLTAFKLFTSFKKPVKPHAGKSQMIKMLTQDGKLVEVDAEKLYCGKRKKISDEQLKNWVNKK